MFKRLLIILSLVAAGAALVARAQDNQPITQPTVDAAVSTLLAATQQAPLRLGATQTVQAALEQALTATAQALITPTPTAVRVDAAHLRLGLTTDIDLLAGPVSTGAYLAPDGVHFAYRTSDTFCLYRGKMKQDCIDLADKVRAIDSESLRWSPNSRYVVFTEDFFHYFNDSDIWVWDTSDNSLHDLTDDGQTRVDIGKDTWTDIDVVPRWLPDGRIVFLRYNRRSGSVLPPDIYVIQPDGSGLQQLGTLSSSDTFAIYALDASATHLAYGYYANEETPRNGVWISDLDGGNAREIIHADRAHAPLGVQLSPDGRYVLVTSAAANFSSALTPENSLVYVADVEQGQITLIDPTQYVTGAGWSPQGSALVYVTRDEQRDNQMGLFVTSAPGTPGQELLPGSYYMATSRMQQTLTWAANDTILLSRTPDKGILLAHLLTEP